MTEARLPRQRTPSVLRTPYAMISHGADRRMLSLGQEITIGRGTGSGIRIAHQPPDEHVSRLTASLRILNDCVLVQNRSTRKHIALRPLVGSERLLEPGAATTSMPHSEFFVVAVGRFGREYSVHVDVRDLTPELPRLVADPLETMDGLPIELAAGQRVLLAALCEPLLTRTGTHAAAPATYRQVADRVGKSPGHVRSVLRRLRGQLAAQGVAALVAFNLEKVHEDFRPALARWAINSGSITVADVQALDALE